jgi:tetratricopeptide (TPR) repeat protein
MTWIIIIVCILGVIFLINKKLSSWQNLYDTGLNHYRAGRYLEATPYLLKADKKNPNNPEILSCYGDCCLKQSLKLDSYGNGDAGLPFKKLAIKSFIESLKNAPSDYHSKQMIEMINEIIKELGINNTEKGLELIKETKNMIHNLPADLQTKFN